MTRHPLKAAIFKTKSNSSREKRQGTSMASSSLPGHGCISCPSRTRKWRRCSDWDQLPEKAPSKCFADAIGLNICDSLNELTDKDQTAHWNDVAEMDSLLYCSLAGFHCHVLQSFCNAKVKNSSTREVHEATRPEGFTIGRRKDSDRCQTFQTQ